MVVEQRCGSTTTGPIKEHSREWSGCTCCRFTLDHNHNGNKVQLPQQLLVSPLLWRCTYHRHHKTSRRIGKQKTHTDCVTDVKRTVWDTTTNPYLLSTKCFDKMAKKTISSVFSQQISLHDIAWSLLKQLGLNEHILGLENNRCEENIMLGYMQTE